MLPKPVSATFRHSDKLLKVLQRRKRKNSKAWTNNFEDPFDLADRSVPASGKRVVKAGKVANEKVTSFLLFPLPPPSLSPFVFFCGGGIKNWKFSSWRTWVENYVLDTHVLCVNEGIDDSEGAFGLRNINGASFEVCRTLPVAI